MIFRNINLNEKQLIILMLALSDLERDYARKNDYDSFREVKELNNKLTNEYLNGFKNE